MLPSVCPPTSGTSCCKSLCFFAIGDTGRNCEELRRVAAAMDTYAAENQPDFILLLGDNFYPNGVTSVDDKRFKDTWEDVFLCYKRLNVPWKVVLGNHDYLLNPEAQIEYTHREDLNKGGLWQCPGKNYKFTHKFGPASHPVSVDFFALDTNGAQFSVRKKYPQIEHELFDNIQALQKQLQASGADWKIVFAHHPMYTKGTAHGITGEHWLQKKLFTNSLYDTHNMITCTWAYSQCVKKNQTAFTYE
jgi:tartrate-resistant acid phosphatase type 5